MALLILESPRLSALVYQRLAPRDMADSEVERRQQARDQYNILTRAEQHPAEAVALYNIWMDEVSFPASTTQYAGLRDLAVASGAELQHARSRADAIRELILRAVPFPTGNEQPTAHGHSLATVLGWYGVTVPDQDGSDAPPPPLGFWRNWWSSGSTRRPSAQNSSRIRG